MLGSILEVTSEKSEAVIEFSNIVFSSNLQHNNFGLLQSCSLSVCKKKDLLAIQPAEENYREFYRNIPFSASVLDDNLKLY